MTEAPVVSESPRGDRTLAEILADGYEVVGAEAGESSYIVVAPKKLAVSQVTSGEMREIGSTSPSPFTSWTRQEYNPQLMGLRGLQKYDEMRRSDATTRSTLRMAKTPVLSARWFVEPASDSKRDQNAADFIWKCFTDYMSVSWPQLLTECLLMLDFGYYMFEKVYDVRVIDGKRRVVWKKLAPRHPMDVKEWHYDENGGPDRVVMYAPKAQLAGLQGGFVQTSMDEVTIPIDKLLVFTFDKEAGNIEGVSLLRSAFKHWYYKDTLYKIDAIQKERHGIGVPIIKLPPNFTDRDKVLADELGRNLRTNERAHVVLPPNWELEFAQLNGNPVNALESIEHHDRAIEKNILAAWLGSTNATKEEDQTMFLKATRFIADIVVDVFNKYAIPQLCDFNFGTMRTGYPKLKARRIGEQVDWRTMSFALRNFIGAGAVTPDDPLEALIREEMDLPRMDPETARDTPSPQGPEEEQDEEEETDDEDGRAEGDARRRKAPPLRPAGPPRVGPPRQTRPNANPPRGTGGQDRSGG
jgi:hypothetical protein